MKEKSSLFNQIDKRYNHKKVYEKKEGIYPNKEKFKMHTDERMMIKTKVDTMCKEIVKKYDIEESEMYEKLYLKVRKLFLELM